MPADNPPSAENSETEPCQKAAAAATRETRYRARPPIGLKRVPEGRLKGYYALKDRVYIDPVVYREILSPLTDAQRRILFQQLGQASRRKSIVIVSDRYLLSFGERAPSWRDRQTPIADFFATQGGYYPDRARHWLRQGLKDFTHSADLHGLTLQHEDFPTLVALKTIPRPHANSNRDYVLKALYANKKISTNDTQTLATLLHEIGHIHDPASRAGKPETPEAAIEREQFAQMYAANTLWRMGLQESVQSRLIFDWVRLMDLLRDSIRLPMPTAGGTRAAPLSETTAYRVKAYSNIFHFRNGQEGLSLARRLTAPQEIDTVVAQWRALQPQAAEEMRLYSGIREHLAHRQHRPEDVLRKQYDETLLTAYMIVIKYWDALTPLSRDVFTRLIFAHVLAAGHHQGKHDKLVLMAPGQNGQKLELDMQPILTRLQEVEAEARENGIRNPAAHTEWFPQKPNPLRRKQKSNGVEATHN